MRWTRALAVLLAVAIPLATGALWNGAASGGAVGYAAPASLAHIPPAPRFTLELLRHRAVVLGRPGRAPLDRAAAEEVRGVMERVYTLGFLDAGAPAPRLVPELEELFAEGIRDRVEDDIDRLTLGSAATRFRGIRPRDGSVVVHILTVRRGEPVLAVASTEFAGTGLSAEGGVPIAHSGRFVLRPRDGGWRIVSYEVEQRIPEPGAFPRVSAIPHPGEPKARRGRATPDVPSKGLLFYLVIGSDARPGERVARLRADSIHIVGINPRRKAGAIVGIPRDSFVSIPGVGTRKINEALHQGGPRLMVRTVRRLTGISIDGYLLTGFKGFGNFMRAVGGVRVDVPYRMNDAASGARFRRGPRHLSGAGALAFARNRHDAPGGDFGRSLNQGRLMLASLRKFRKAVRLNPAVLLTWLVAGMRTIRTDLSLGDILGLMLAAPGIHPARVRNEVVSGTGATVGGASVVRLGGPALAIFRDLRRDAMLGR